MYHHDPRVDEIPKKYIYSYSPEQKSVFVHTKTFLPERYFVFAQTNCYIYSVELPLLKLRERERERERFDTFKCTIFFLTAVFQAESLAYTRTQMNTKIFHELQV